MRLEGAGQDVGLDGSVGLYFTCWIVRRKQDIVIHL